MINSFFIDKEIPVIISEVGVITEEEKKIESIREFLYVVFAISANYNGIASCLWDTSNKTLGNMNYFNRETNKWYDEKIRYNFKQISKGKYIKPLEYFSMTNSITTYAEDYSGMFIKIGNKKPLKAIFNIKYIKNDKNNNFFLQTYDKRGGMFTIDITKSQKKKEYDGTYTFTVDIRNIDCNYYIELDKYDIINSISFNNLTIEFEEQFLYFDYKYYKKAISSYI